MFDTLVIIGDRLRRWLALFMPGEYMARKIDNGHAKLVEGIKREARKGNRKLRVFHYLAIGEHFLAVAVGLAAGYLVFFLLVPIAFVLWPFVAWGDLRLWRSARTNSSNSSFSRAKASELF